MLGEIPFLDLITPHRTLRNELLDVVRSALNTGHFVGGAEVENFEKEFAAFCQTSHCVAVSSGTDALRLALIASGVGKGDVVITVPNTFIATSEAITQAGAEVAFVDIDERTYNMDPQKLQEYLDSHRGAAVKAVAPVHLYGQMADMDAIQEIADRHGVMVIEDACQAHGAEYHSKKANQWKRAGSMGCAAGFSFYPGKNLGACGEGGAVTTNDSSIAQRVRMLRDHGQSKKYCHELEGYNGRLDAIQCGILRIKLRHLESWNGLRRQAAARYREYLGKTEEIVLPYEPAWSRAIHHLYVIRCPERSDMQAHLTNQKIGTGLHYPIPLHLQNAYANRGYKQGDFPVTERTASEILSLPMFPQITAEQQKRIAEQINIAVAAALQK
jgi:dTDP-4-amino-4,6-dideoxygalactose transaminase